MKERRNFKNVTRMVCLCTGIALMISVMGLCIFVQAFPYNKELHKRAEIADEKAAQRVKAIKEMQIESMCKDDRFDHSNCE